MNFSQIDIDFMIALVRQAGEEIMKIYQQDFDVEYKSDNSPLTLADKKANEILINGLKEKYPNSNFISEENKEIPFDERKHWQSFWLIDPLDGTKEFVKKNGEFTVNVALIEKDIPTFGVVFAPVLNLLYYGLKNVGSFKIDEVGKCTKLIPTAHYLSKENITVVASRSHLTTDTLGFVKDLEAKGKKVNFLSSGSSLKFCLVAEGSADVYPRYSPTMEWDTAAAHAVVLYAGKDVLQIPSQASLIYNKENLLNPYFVVE